MDIDVDPMALDPKKLEKTLRALKLDDWKVVLRHEQKSGLYLTRMGEVETGLDSVRTQADVTIYRRFGSEAGDSTFTVFDDDEQELRRKVADAIAICAVAKKGAWTLPGKQRYEKTALADTAIIAAFRKGKSGSDVLKLWQEIETLARKERGIKIASAEVQLLAVTTHIVNSQGLRGASDGTQLTVELILTSYKGKKEQEFVASKDYGRVSDFDAAAFVREAAQTARDILAATDFKGVQETGIVLTGEALRDFWAPELGLSPVLFHATARAKHMSLSRFERGQRVSANTGLTVVSNPLLAYNPASNLMDFDGTASRKVVIIDRGTCANLMASQRYAQYLKVPATGGIGAVELSAGAENAAALRTDGTIEIVVFSSFAPNSISGDFSAEIRLGYLHKGGKRLPLRAAMLSGNALRMLDAMRLSKETMTVDRYKGPSAARFDAGATLSGL